MTTKPFVFKSSKLSSAADQLWTASKSGFKADEKSIKLDLGRTLTNEKCAQKSTSVEEPKKSNFIFGSKLSERAVVNHKDDKDGSCHRSESTSENSVKDVSKVFEDIKQKGTCSSFVQKKNKDSDEGASTSDMSSNGFKDAMRAANVETKFSLPREDEIEIVTGEEGEHNIFNSMCKIHSFDITTNAWTERGMCSLRINQRDETRDSHRIVARGTGNKRVILNSQIFTDMLVEKISDKRVKFSATAPNSEVPVLFLATASENATEQLYSLLVRILDNKKADAVRKRRANEEENEDDETVPKKIVF